MQAWPVWLLQPVTQTCRVKGGAVHVAAATTSLPWDVLREWAGLCETAAWVQWALGGMQLGEMCS